MAMRFSFVYQLFACAVIFSSSTFLSSGAFGQTTAPAAKPIDLDTYEAAVQGQIRSDWTTAPDISFGGCTCTFTITSGGDMKGLVIKDSSGVDSYDQSCLDAIGRAAPFSAIPNVAGSIAVSAHFDCGGGERDVNLDMTPVPSFISTAKSLAELQVAESLNTPGATINPVDLSPYITAARSKIEQTWAPPIASAGLVSCAISIGPLGSLSNIRVVPSFGTSDFNDSASDAIAKCDPFPQLPPGVNSLSLMVTFEKSGQSKKVDAVQN